MNVPKGLDQGTVSTKRGLIDLVRRRFDARPFNGNPDGIQSESSASFEIRSRITPPVARGPAAVTGPDPSLALPFMPLARSFAAFKLKSGRGNTPKKIWREAQHLEWEGVL